MVTVMIEMEDGYAVEGRVVAESGGPGLRPGLTVEAIERSWVTDEDCFRSVHQDVDLSEVVERQWDAICDELIDEAHIQIEYNTDWEDC